MRPLVKYDLDEPPAANPHPNIGVTRRDRGSWQPRPPAKKHKWNHNAQNPSSLPQHWDDPGSSAVGVVYDEEGSTSIAAGSTTMSHVDDIEEGVDRYGEAAAEVEMEEERGGEEEESRPLTHEEIWDDAALIDAWNSAEAEYEAYHGKSKAWKTEPLKRSPLWYNTPYTAPAPKPGPSKPKSRSRDGECEPDTAPLDFDTYVPTHDPSLGIPSDTNTGTNPAVPTPFFVPPPLAAMVSRDEAFNNALSAMYWSGYWTAVYHCQSQTNGNNNSGPTETVEEDGIMADEDEDEEDLAPAQR